MLDSRPRKRLRVGYTSNVLEDLIEAEDRKILYEKILSLKGNYRELIILYYFCDFSIKDISKLKNMSESWVKTNLLRGRNRLRIEMEEKNEL